MAGPVGGSSFNIKFELLKKGHEFSFFQVMRLIRLLGRGPERSGVQEEGEKENVRVRPELSLAFPAADVAKIEETAGEGFGYRVTTTFLGLYGSSSPLPTFYTEDLLEEAEGDSSVSRDFLDIIHHRLFSLFFRCWTKYRLFLQVVEEKNLRDLERLFCLLGLGEEELRREIPEPLFLLRYIGLFTQFPRSASGLETLLQDSLGGVPVDIMPCLLRRVKIPADQRFSLGITANLLGQDSFLGEEIDDRMGKIRLQIGPLNAQIFHDLLPGRPQYQKLAFLTKFYLVEPLEYDIELILTKGEVKTACLGAPKWSGLGCDTWTFSGEYAEEVKAVFPPQNNQGVKA
jgi:type VI secretion system protein ImpH